jgi:hypothetical protein
LAPGNNYEWQTPSRMPVPSDLNGSNRANEQNRAPLIHRTDSTNSSQPSTKNKPALSIALPRVDVRSPAPEPEVDYLEPKKRLRDSFASADKHEHNWPDGQRKPSHVVRTESDRLAYRPPASTKNLHR